MSLLYKHVWIVIYLKLTPKVKDIGGGCGALQGAASFWTHFYFQIDASLRALWSHNGINNRPNHNHIFLI